MKTSSNIYIRIVIALGSIAVYAAIFPILYPLAGEATAAFTVIPMAIIGWLLGVRGSLLFGILTVPLHNILLRLIGAPAFAIIPGLIGSFAFTLIGMSTGWIRELLDRVNKQAEELREERKILQEEMDKRVKAERRLTH